MARITGSTTGFSIAVPTPKIDTRITDQTMGQFGELFDRLDINNRVALENLSSDLTSRLASEGEMLRDVLRNEISQFDRDLTSLLQNLNSELLYSLDSGNKLIRDRLPTLHTTLLGELRVFNENPIGENSEISPLVKSIVEKLDSLLMSETNLTDKVQVVIDSLYKDSQPILYAIHKSVGEVVFALTKVYLRLADLGHEDTLVTLKDNVLKRFEDLSTLTYDLAISSSSVATNTKSISQVVSRWFDSATSSSAPIQGIKTAVETMLQAFVTTTGFRTLLVSNVCRDQTGSAYWVGNIVNPKGWLKVSE